VTDLIHQLSSFIVWEGPNKDIPVPR
jgi:hypothetical protein